MPYSTIVKAEEAIHRLTVELEELRKIRRPTALDRGVILNKEIALRTARRALHDLASQK